MSSCNPSTPGTIVPPALPGDMSDPTPYYTQAEVNDLLLGKADLSEGKLEESQDLYGPEKGWTEQENILVNTTLTPEDFGTLHTVAGYVTILNFNPVGRNGKIGFFVTTGAQVTFNGPSSIYGDDGTPNVNNTPLTSGLYILHALGSSWVLEGYGRFTLTNP